MTVDFSDVVPARGKQLIRFGWAISELRGRVYFGSEDPGRLLEASSTASTSFMLPLGEERSPGDLLTTVVGQVRELTNEVALPGDATAMEGLETIGVAPSTTAADLVLQLAGDVPDHRNTNEWTERWLTFALALYQWDLQIQGTLAALTFGESSAYQLGRGLAETSWSYDPSPGSDSTMKLGFLIGPKRSFALTTLVSRLTPDVVGLDAAKCIKGSLARWSEEMQSGKLGENGRTTILLRRQALLWRDLLLCGNTPQALVPPLAPLHRVEILIPALRSFWPQFVAGVLSAGVLGYAAYLFSSAQSSDLLKTIVTALGTVGLTGAGISAKASSSVSGLATRFQEALKADQLVEAATFAPKPGGIRHRFSYSPGQFAAPLSTDSVK